ncbi:MAG: PAS domain S-box protein [Hyphomicrobiaceae bacterium]
MYETYADILIVDDQEASRLSKTAILRRDNWNIIEATTGSEALQLFSERLFDLVVLDADLPDQSGIEVGRQIKQQRPDVMVLQTSSGHLGYGAADSEPLADGYLVEPIRPEELVAQVRTLLRLRWAERRQEEAEALLAHSLEASAIGTWEWDIAEDRLKLSDVFSELLGHYEKPFSQERPWNQFVLPQDQPILDEALAEAIEKRGMLNVEFRVRRRDGEVRWLAARGRMSDGSRSRMTGVIVDVTDRKIAEEKAARLEAIVAQSPEAIISYDLEHRIQSWNRGAEVLFGFSEKEIIGKTPQETIVPPQYYEQSAQIHHEALAGKIQNFETQRQTKDGRLIDVTLTAAQIHDRQGNPLGKLVIVRDITEKKKAERALVAAQQRMQAVLEAVPVGICFSADATCKYVMGNSALFRQFEIEPGTVLSLSEKTEAKKRTRLIQDGRELPFEEVPLKRAVVENRIIEPVEFEVHLPSGRTWICEASAAPVRGPNGEVIGGVAVTVDVTERKRTEQHINLLIAETNHRAKNLLSVVQGIARLTAPASDPKVFAERLSQRLRALAINQDLLVRANWEGIEFEDLVRSQLEPFQGLVSSRCTISGPPLRVSPSAAQAIGMALHELATNASKYGALSGPEGKLAVSWDIDMAGQEPICHIRWREFGGPEVEQPARKGFGHTVIVHFVEQALGADVRLSYNPGGVEWEVTAPLGRVMEHGSKLDARSLEPQDHLSVA